MATGGFAIFGDSLDTALPASLGNFGPSPHPSSQSKRTACTGVVSGASTRELLIATVITMESFDK
ncbi:hypothetical protein FRC0543_00259 [Corynebacterium diphtheriae]|nr:hypothetical protein FRC0376_00354 [Corynebacterium diphtheriae]CAB0889036.1 hypothetical protein FRC0409_00259 [Corynebacterium diphtheriae]CAB1029254.1 hypothetical protein FRC0543_00259 [Corynebacterium diphtheriae]CAB1029351.1 hypothetical protein FRC0544_00257 [Corynebacterium diphtheriae]